MLSGLTRVTLRAELSFSSFHFNATLKSFCLPHLFLYKNQNIKIYNINE